MSEAAKQATEAEVEAVAKAIARLVPIDGSSRWHPMHGHNFPDEYSAKEQGLIRWIARTAAAAISRAEPTPLPADRKE